MNDVVKQIVDENEKRKNAERVIILDSQETPMAMGLEIAMHPVEISGEIDSTKKNIAMYQGLVEKYVARLQALENLLAEVEAQNG